MTLNDIEDRICQYLSKKQGVSIPPTFTFEQAGLNSLDTVELLMVVEDTFSLPVTSNKDLEKMSTIRNVAEYVFAKTNQSAA